ncbi:low molecular weight protein-tyrosine-phosphatase [Synechococcus sp. CS-1332]|uniref:low molecular weight protein-tyrosine-phosphatase n=1 Tax=Synechococcus sp. CS-1332 TaxID=2847972 RepID=UPI00223C0A1B|nr:low molecular weight protein-tyrosine-phosphatase [Synechococcus sp. CS-1332]
MTTPPEPPAAPLAMAQPTSLLFVCLGNICRSPAAEGVFLHLIGLQGLEHAFRADSAGTGDWHVGRPADERMRSAAARRGIDLPSRARQITHSDLSRFDHVLTMDRQNLKAVRGLAGKGEATAQISPLTGYCRRYDIEEVPDPYYGGEEGFDRVLDLLEDACGGLLETLTAERTQR